MVKIAGRTGREIPTSDVRSRELRGSARAVEQDQGGTLPHADPSDFMEKGRESGHSSKAVVMGAVMSAISASLRAHRYISKYWATRSTFFFGSREAIAKYQAELAAADAAAGTKALGMLAEPRVAKTAGIVAALCELLVSGRRNIEAVKAGEKSTGEAVADTSRDAAVAGGSSYAGMMLGSYVAGSVLPQTFRFGGPLGFGIGLAASVALSRLAHRVID